MRQQKRRNDRGEDDDGGSWVPHAPRPKELT
jgi:hypothetical protein